MVAEREAVAWVAKVAAATALVSWDREVMEGVVIDLVAVEAAAKVVLVAA